MKQEKNKLIFSKKDSLNNNLLEFVSELVDIHYNQYFKITKEYLDESYDYDIRYNPEDFIPLIGYEVKVVRKGDHRNDGQMVDYGFYFKSPSGKITKVWTEKCLMIGWNHWEDVEIE